MKTTTTCSIAPGPAGEGLKTNQQCRGQYEQKLGTNGLEDCAAAGGSKVFVFVELAVDDLVTIEIFDVMIDNVNDPHNKDTESKRTPKDSWRFRLKRNETHE